MKKNSSLLLLFLLFLTSCQNNQNENNEFSFATTVATEAYRYEDARFLLTIDQAIIDFQFMWEFLDEHLPSFNLIERISRTSVEDIREEGMLYLMSHDSDFISIRDFHDFLAQHLGIFHSLSHLSVVGSGIAEILLHPDNLSLIFEEIIFDLEWTQAVYGHLLSFEGIVIHEAVNSRPQFQIIDDYTAVIDILSFLMFDHESDEFHKLYLSFYEEATAFGIENLIFDISRNGGGNTRHWIEHIVAPNIEEEVFFERFVFARDTDLVVNYIDFWFDIWYNRTVEMRSTSGIPIEIMHPEDLFESSLYGVIEDSILPNNNGKPAFEGNIFVLIDGFSFSASDAFAHFVYQTDFATLIGRPTGGSGIGIQPMAFSLPESGLLVRFDVFYGINADGSANQGVGTTPHYFSNDYFPLETALRIIEERRSTEQD